MIDLSASFTYMPLNSGTSYVKQPVSSTGQTIFYSFYEITPAAIHTR